MIVNTKNYQGSVSRSSTDVAGEYVNEGEIGKDDRTINDLGLETH